MLNPDRNTLEFKPERAVRLVLVITWLLFAIIFAALTYGLQAEVYRPADQVLMNYWYTFMGVFFLFSVFFVFNFCSKKLIVADTAITYWSLFRTKSVPLKLIKGVRNVTLLQSEGIYQKIKPKFIYKAQSTTKSLSTFQNKQLRNWAAENFIDLDHADYEEEVAEIRADKNIGATVEERDKKYSKAKQIQNAVIGIGGLLLFSAVIFHLPRTIALSYIVLSSAYIVFGLIFYKGLVRMEWTSARVGMSMPILMITFIWVIAFTSIGSIDLPLPEARLKFAYMAIAVVVVTIAYIVLIVGLKNYKFKRIWMTLLLFGALLFLNEKSLNILLDHSEPKSYTTTIREYKITSYRGWSYSYTMGLEAWSEASGSYNEVGVSQDTYINLASGTLVDIKEYQGAFGQKWFIAYYQGEKLNDAETSFSKVKKQGP